MRMHKVVLLIIPGIFSDDSFVFLASEVFCTNMIA